MYIYICIYIYAYIYTYRENCTWCRLASATWCGFVGPKLAVYTAPMIHSATPGTRTGEHQFFRQWSHGNSMRKTLLVFIMFQGLLGLESDAYALIISDPSPVHKKSISQKRYAPQRWRLTTIPWDQSGLVCWDGPQVAIKKMPRVFLK